MNLPNKLTILRILMVPVFLFFGLFTLPGAWGANLSRLIAAVIFAAAAITDFADGKIGAINLMVACGLCASNGEARRLIQQGGVAVNDEKVTGIDAAFDMDAFSGDGVIIKKGKKVFHRAFVK